MEKRPYFSNSAYDILKQGTQINLPIFGSLYFVLSWFLDVPKVEIVLGAIMIIVAFFGLLLKASLTRYNHLREGGWSGQMVISTRPDGKRSYSLELDIDPDDIENLTELMFKVQKESPRT